MGVGGGGAAPSAPFSFTPTPKGQSPFGVGGTGANIFSFPGGAGGATAGAATPNFSFDFAAQKPKAEKEGGEEGEDDEDDEEDEDPVEEFIKSLPEPVQKCVSALDTLDEEICGLETQFRKDLRDLERKVSACSLLWRVAPHMWRRARGVLEVGQGELTADGGGRGCLRSRSTRLWRRQSSRSAWTS